MSHSQTNGSFVTPAGLMRKATSFHRSFLTTAVRPRGRDAAAVARELWPPLRRGPELLVQVCSLQQVFGLGVRISPPLFPSCFLRQEIRYVSFFFLFFFFSFFRPPVSPQGLDHRTCSDWLVCFQTCWLRHTHTHSAANDSILFDFTLRPSVWVRSLIISAANCYYSSLRLYY